jgi:hypothetical protein
MSKLGIDAQKMRLKDLKRVLYGKEEDR